MASIFLSYAREDTRKAQRIAEALEAAAHNVWWDRQVHAGSRFTKEIDAALRGADLVMVLWSNSSVDSAWVHDEAAAGRDSGRLVPVLIEPVEPPLGFRQYQAVDLSSRGSQSQAAFDRLIAAVADKLGAHRPAKPVKQRYRWAHRPRLWLAAASLLLIVATAAIALIALRSGKAEAEPASLAILPFKNMSAGDPYFAEGVAEEISNQLAREPQFRVAGRTSAALFKDAADLRDVGRRLQVTYVLEGSVRSAGNQVRVEVALVETRHGMQLWSQNFRGNLDDIFAIQESIGQQVASHVRKQLVRRVLPDTLKANGEVYSLYLTARSLMHQREPAKIAAAVDLLKRAVKLDPNFAPAWAQLALALQLDNVYGHPDEPNYGSSSQQRLGLAEHAVALAPTLPEAHAVAGVLLLGNHDIDVAKIRKGREELEKAVRLNPSDAESWFWLHYNRWDNLDFDGALDALRRSARADPFFGLVGEHLPGMAWDMGYPDEALHFLNDRIADHPDPFVREIARVERASLQNDSSSAYQYAKQAREIASPDLRSIAEDHMGAILLNLGLLDEAQRFVPPAVVDLWRGKLSFAKGLRNAFPRALDFWRFMDGDPHLMPRLLVKLGRSAELVSLYDEAFSSPENMAKRYSKPAFIEMAPMVAIALHKSGRREGARILLLADEMCRRGLQGDHAPRSVRVSCSRLWAVLGRKELAIQTLEQAVREGSRPVIGEFPLVGDEPAYAVIRNEPRIKRIDAMLAAEDARERRELLAAGV